MGLVVGKDGTALVMTSVSRFGRANDIGGTAVSLVRLWRVLAGHANRRTTAAYGDFS